MSVLSTSIVLIAKAWSRCLGERTSQLQVGRLMIWGRHGLVSRHMGTRSGHSGQESLHLPQLQVGRFHCALSPMPFLGRTTDYLQQNVDTAQHPLDHVLTRTPVIYAHHAPSTSSPTKRYQVDLRRTRDGSNNASPSRAARSAVRRIVYPICAQSISIHALPRALSVAHLFD